MNRQRPREVNDELPACPGGQSRLDASPNDGIPTDTEDIAMGVVTLLVLTVGGESGSPLDRVLPEPVVLHIRMLALREGMSPSEVERRIGLKDLCPISGRGTISNWDEVYAVGTTHRLTLEFSLTGRDSYGLHKATLRTIDTK